MKKLIKYSRQAVFCALCLISTAVLSQELKNGHPTEYVVKKGDTLWDISATFLEDPWKWPEVWKMNQQIANPHLIYPGDLIRLIYVDGQPQLVLDRGVIKLSPQVRTTRHDEAISSIPLDSVREFFTQNRVISKKQLDKAPYMVAGPEGRIMVGSGDTLYVRGPVQEDVKIYEVFKEGDKYHDPETGKVIGVRAESVGTARYRNTSGEISRFEVVESTAEIVVGSRLLPLEQDQLNPQLFPEIPDSVVSGEIIAVEGGVSQIGTLDVVAINRGADAELDVGSLLAIMEAGERVRDRVEGGTVKLPDEQAGMLMIFKVYDQMSFGLILESEKTLKIGHHVTNMFSQAAYEQSRIDAEEDKRQQSVLYKIQNTKVVKGITNAADNVGELFEPDTRPEKGAEKASSYSDDETASEDEAEAEKQPKGLLYKVRDFFSPNSQPE